MRVKLGLTALALGGLMLSGCATLGDEDRYASACERDYARNRELATASGAVLGAAVGAALAGDNARDRERAATLGAVAGALLGNQLSAEDDPCGYGFGGYNRDYRYGRERVYWRDGYDRRW